MKTTLRRSMAYVLDAILITFVTLMINQLTYVNPNYEEYIKVSEEYSELVDDSEDITELQSNPQYEILQFNLIKNGEAYLITEVIVVILYFVVFQKYNNGQTLGKKIAKVKIENINGKDLSLLTLFLRTIFIYNIVPLTFAFTAINLLNMNIFFDIYNIISVLFTILTYVIIFLIVYRKDGKGLHDLVFKTKVVEE